MSDLKGDPRQEEKLGISFVELKEKCARMGQPGEHDSCNYPQDECPKSIRKRTSNSSPVTPALRQLRTTAAQQSQRHYRRANPRPGARAGSSFAAPNAMMRWR
jgi:hypothetical protein